MTDKPTFTGPDASIRIYMAETIARVAPDCTLREVAMKLASVEVGALVVGSDDEGVDGMVSERDIVRAVAGGLDVDTCRAADVASSDVVRCSADATVAEVAHVMMERYVRHVVISEHNRVVGVVSARDLLGAYASM